MASALGTHQKGSVNVELNIVPFIDLMSCLTAFLLVTAVWINLANVRNDPAGRGREHPNDDPPPRLAILLDTEHITVTAVPSGEIRQLAASDWGSLESTLRAYTATRDLPQIEIAAASTDEHPIAYQSLIAAMDTAVKAGFPRVGVTDPDSLSR